MRTLRPTAQAASLPAALSGRDLIVQAPTGSGKTAAFGLALLNRLDPAVWQVQAMALRLQTRALAPWSRAGAHPAVPNRSS